jgi:hypothetical protein
MRYIKFLMAAAVVACLVGAATSSADLSNGAVVIVRMTVAANVAIHPVNVNVNIGSFQIGDLTASIDYQVDANKQEVSFFVEASSLYKGDDPTNLTVAPLAVNLSKGVLVSPANGNATGGHGNTLAFSGGTGALVPGDAGQLFPTSKTETVQFTSSQNNHFSQNVNIKVTWTITDPEQPTGEYSGVVKLTALVAP